MIVTILSYCNGIANATYNRLLNVQHNNNETSTDFRETYFRLVSRDRGHLSTTATMMRYYQVLLYF